MFVGSNIPKSIGVLIQVPIMLVVCLLVLIFLSLYWSVVLVPIMLVVCLLGLIFLSLYWSVDTGSNHVGGLFVGSNIPKSLLEC